MTLLKATIDFVGTMQARLRFGELSRATLRLIRFELCGEVVTCEWVARLPDPWDEAVAAVVRQDNVTRQALQDAIQMRDLIFKGLPGVRRAFLRVYRQSASESPDLIISGTVTRDDEVPARLGSLVMRAKLLGLHFCLDAGELQSLEPQEQERDLKFAT